MPFIFSTLTCGQDYAEWEDGGGDLKTIKRKVTVRGGANVANKKTLVTPLGVPTEVSEDDLAFLKAHPEFQRHLKGGFVTISSKNHDPEKVVSDMKGPDESAPLTPADFQKEDGVKLFQGTGRA